MLDFDTSGVYNEIGDGHDKHASFYCSPDGVESEVFWKYDRPRKRTIKTFLYRYFQGFLVYLWFWSITTNGEDISRNSDIDITPRDSSEWRYDDIPFLCFEYVNGYLSYVFSVWNVIIVYLYMM